MDINGTGVVNTAEVLVSVLQSKDFATPAESGP
jgi:hypothetical protein